MKITRIAFPLNPTYPKDKEFPLDENVLVKKRFRKRQILVQIGELDLRIGDKVKFERNTNKQYIIKKSTKEEKSWFKFCYKDNFPNGIKRKRFYNFRDWVWCNILKRKSIKRAIKIYREEGI